MSYILFLVGCGLVVFALNRDRKLKEKIGLEFELQRKHERPKLILMLVLGFIVIAISSILGVGE